MTEKVIRKSKKQFKVYKDMYNFGISQYKLVGTCESYKEAKKILESGNKKDTSGFITADGILIDTLEKNMFENGDETIEE